MHTDNFLSLSFFKELSECPLILEIFCCLDIFRYLAFKLTMLYTLCTLSQ